jgi:hypothetical protein
LDEEEDAAKVSPAIMKADKLSAPAGYVITRPLFFFSTSEIYVQSRRALSEGSREGDGSLRQ